MRTATKTKNVTPSPVDPAPADSAPGPKPISAKKLAANRANARRSTGPKTPQGKARSAMNALWHGFTARSSAINVLPGEDPDELDALQAEMEADLRPRGAMERELVARIVGLMWRLRRVARLEEYLWEQQDEGNLRGFFATREVRREYGLPDPAAEDDPPDEVEAMEFLASQFEGTGPSRIERIGIYEQRLDRALHAAIRQLRQTQQMRERREDRETPAPREFGSRGFEIGSDNPERQNGPTVSPEIQRNTPSPVEKHGAVESAQKEISRNEPTAHSAPQAGLLNGARGNHLESV